MHEESGLQDRRGRSRLALRVAKKQDLSQQPCFGVEILVSDQGNRTIPGFVALADSKRLIGDEAEKPDSQEFGVQCERKLASMSLERRDLNTRHRVSGDT